MPAADLRGLDLFDGVPDSALPQLAGAVEWLQVAPGETVFTRGERDTEVFLVAEGELVGLMLSHSGREVAVTQFHAGSVFGHLAAIDDRARDLTIQAVVSSRVGRIPARTFNHWIDTNPVIARNLLRILAAEVRVLHEAVFGIVVHPVETRVRLKLEQLFRSNGKWHRGGALDPAPSHSLLAAQVGANREAVSRVLSTLSKAGLLETGRRRMRLLDPEGLKRGL